MEPPAAAPMITPILNDFLVFVDASKFKERGGDKGSYVSEEKENISKQIYTGHNEKENISKLVFLVYVKYIYIPAKFSYGSPKKQKGPKEGGGLKVWLLSTKPSVKIPVRLKRSWPDGKTFRLSSR